MEPGDVRLTQSKLRGLFLAKATTGKGPSIPLARAALGVVPHCISPYEEGL
jgi:hypothetical protein